jgi:hypothetical protein
MRHRVGPSDGLPGGGTAETGLEEGLGGHLVFVQGRGMGIEQGTRKPISRHFQTFPPTRRRALAAMPPPTGQSQINFPL